MNVNKNLLALGMSVFVFVLCTGCVNSKVVQEMESEGSPASGTKYLAESEPDSALSVAKAREVVLDDQSVTLVGMIGGSSEPFVDGLAAFTIVDTEVPHCSPDEGCPTPWDYCCTQDQVAQSIATVKVVDESEDLIAVDARDLLGVKELSTVVVEGTAKRDDKGNLTVTTTKVFVRQ